MDGLSLNYAQLAKRCWRTLARLLNYYSRLLQSREQWVGFASQSLFHNPYLAASDMLFVHPGAAHGAISRCLANGWAALGTCGIYSNGRDEIFRMFGLLTPNSLPTYCAAILTDTAYGFLLNVPGFMVNYALSGCGLLPSIIMGMKASAAVCWTSSISGGLFDTFHALDSDDPQRKARAPILARWAVIDRFDLAVRKRMIWVCLVLSIAATAAIYCFAPGGLIR
ncbi:MAG TPA: hypothetical protein VGO67_07160 [Verrucomicrobiae bacterium]